MTNREPIDVSAEELLKQAFLLRDRGDLPTAETMFLAGMKRFPDMLDQYGHPAFHKELMRMLLASQEWDKAMALIPKVGITHWHDILFARAYSVAQDAANAAIWWRRVIDQMPDNQEAKSWLSQADSDFVKIGEDRSIGRSAKSVTRKGKLQAWPVAVMSFNRPDYLFAVLESFLNQDIENIQDFPVYLFQDGAINPLSRKVYADQSDIDECVKIFRKAIPWGSVVQAPANLGVALNFERAEYKLFEDLKSEIGIFLEDDLVLEPSYFRVLDLAIKIAQADDRVGYVSVYGDHRLTAEEQKFAPERYTLLEHNWAFALTRKQWLMNKPYVDAYLKIVRKYDYRARPESEIYRLFHEWGVGCPGTSQDVAKTLACCLNKVVKLNISACLASYIGAKGLHMNPEIFEERKYQDTKTYTGRISKLNLLSAQEFDRIFGVQLGWATEMPCAF